MNAPTEQKLEPPGVQRPGRRWLLALCVGLAAGLAAPGCGRPGGPGGGGGDAPGRGSGEGPGGRQQPLALSPAEELELGRKAYREILRKSDVVRSGPEVDRVRQVGNRIVEAAKIKPLQREINLRVNDKYLEWEFNVLRDPQVNAFCLPGGKVGVLTGMLRVVSDDDAQLATVIAHEIAHALAHHASERVAREHMVRPALRAVNSNMNELDRGEQDRLISLLSGLSGKAYERQQETEADHIGTFLMTFAGYEPQKGVDFWQRMRWASQGGRPPEIFSSHPSDERRIAQMESWVPYARAAKKAYEEGRIAPGADR